MKYSAALRRLSDGETSMNDFDNEILPTDPDEGEEITERVAGRETYEWVRSLVGAVLVITLLFTFVVRLMGVDGHSMVPTLQDGDRLIVAIFLKNAPKDLPVESVDNLLNLLLSLGIITQSTDKRINMPEIYLHGFGLKRKGGLRRT